MIPEAVDTAVSIGWAIVAWIVIIAAAVTAALTAVALGINAVWRAVTWPARARTKHADAREYQEAA
ncbi:hypothetical protein ACFXKI_09860 [Streptomyces mirabilis]|uniref:hypothetical protein n=1 Tax=Streptomyces mirabilis TaxID=68239 RepID=UPI0036C59419